MVGRIDIHKLNLEELTGVVGLYPWYGAAHKELCVRMKEMGALSDTLISQAALHICSRRILFDLTHEKSVPSDQALKAEQTAREAAPAETPDEQVRKIFVVGGDYFSQSQYSGVRKSDDNIFSSFASKAREEGYSEPEAQGLGDICTETLAQIYAEQGYFAEAKEIYSKLSLRYPEKSVYFASLIEEINKNN